MSSLVSLKPQIAKICLPSGLSSIGNGIKTAMPLPQAPTRYLLFPSPLDSRILAILHPPCGKTALKNRPSTVSLRNPSGQRLVLSRKYEDSKANFSHVEEFRGILPNDFEAVRYHGEKDSKKWWMDVKTANECATLKDVQDKTAHRPEWGDSWKAVSYLFIPKGTSARFLKGKAAPQGEFRGGCTQYRFYELDPKWIVSDRKLSFKPS